MAYWRGGFEKLIGQVHPFYPCQCVRQLDELLSQQSLSLFVARIIEGLLYSPALHHTIIFSDRET